jgi:vacuolar-type H+-ATPase subunit E/Vma4
VSTEENEKLKKFISAVNYEIDLKVSDMLKEAENEKKSIISAAKEESEIAAEKYMESSRKKTGNKYVRDISKAELDMKKEVLRRREELSEKVFDSVEKRIAEYRKTNAYADGLIKTLLLMNVGNGAEIRLAPEDMKYSDALKKVIKSEDVTFTADSSVKFGGLSVYFKEKGTIVDKTFDLALEEQKNVFVGSNAFAE